MTAKTIAIAQQKGGAGKTTIAVQLGVAWASQGYRVAVLGIDPQGSLAAWYRLRNGKGNPLFAADVQGWRLASEIDRLRTDFDLLVIDTPPHAETDARVAVRSASLILVPVQPSPLDLWAMAPTLDLAKKEKTPFMLVLNRLPPRGKLTDAVRAEIAGNSLPLAAASLGNRSAFAASMMEGKGVVESQPNGTAALEIRQLADEIASIIGLPEQKAAE